MKIAVPLLIATSLLTLSFNGPSQTEAAKDREAIVKAALDYFEGWYQGDPARMERALHPELAKRTVQDLPNGRNILRSVTAPSMVEYTRLGVEKAPSVQEKEIHVTILEVHKSMASAKIVSTDYYDYLHLGKCNGEWKIINVLWLPNREKE